MRVEDTFRAWLDTAVAGEQLRAVDRAFALFLRTLDAGADERVLTAAALASRELGNGHIGVDVEALLGDLWADPERALALPAHPEASEWLAALRGSPLVDAQAAQATSSDTPLVLDGGRLYLRRYWRYEQRVADAIKARLPFSQAATPALAAGLAQLFPDRADGSVDWQKVACALAARQAFTVITGGPGTGKTTTVVRLLGLLQSLAMANGASRLRIRLAAPTGKAAARLNESIAAQIQALPLAVEIREAIPAEVTTLHRLLGSRADTRHFVHHRGNPLHVDVLVIDEASMVDLEMMAAVLDALPDTAQLVLLGDKDQLSSVEAGAVLGDLCQRAEKGHYDAASVAWLKEVADADVGPWAATDATPLDQHVAMLRLSHRFDRNSGIGALALAVNNGAVARVREVLGDALPGRDIAYLPQADVASLAIDGLATGAPGYRHYLRVLKETRPGHDSASYEAWATGVLDAFAHFQLLCALRVWDAGVAALNESIAQGLRKRALIEAAHGWYEGRPVLVSRNDYSLGLMNGDIGIALHVPDEQGEPHLRVAFRVAGDERRDGTHIRFVAPSRLTSVETVFAMTVHKSQGSEFAHTALVLPSAMSPVLTRELLYTGITRARRWFTLVAPQAVVDATVQRRTRRASGLRERF